MKNWQEMKDFSFVGIKLTKAHSISEGLKRCQVQKLTRNNPVYQHLKLHQKYKKMKNCIICLRAHSAKPHETPCSYSLTEPIIKTCSSQNKFIFKKKMSKQQSQKLNEKKQWSEGPSKRELSRKQILNFTNKIQGLTDDLRKTQSTYFKLDKDRARLQNKFLIDMRQLQVGIDQDVGICLEELSKNKSIFRSSLQRKKMKMKKDNEKVKRLNKKVVFPFSHKQMESIVLEDKKNKQNIEVKSHKMLRSLYDYKSSANYSHRMNAIKNIIEK